MAEKAKLRRTITDLGYAPITSVDVDGKPTYGEVTWLVHNEAGGREYEASPAGTATSIWADGREVYASEENQGYDTTLTTLNVVDDIEEDWYGFTVTEDGVEEYANDEEYPSIALVIIEATTDGVGETTVFYNAHIKQRSTKTGRTSEGNGLNPQFPEHQFACRPRLDCMAVKKVLPQKTKFTTIPEPSMALPAVKLAKSTEAVSVGSTVTLAIASLRPESAAITWTSGTQAKATVDSSGKVTGVAAGTSVITASITVDGTTYTDTCTVTVTASGT